MRISANSIDEDGESKTDSRIGLEAFFPHPSLGEASGSSGCSSLQAQALKKLNNMDRNQASTSRHSRDFPPWFYEMKSMIQKEVLDELYQVLDFHREGNGLRLAVESVAKSRIAPPPSKNPCQENVLHEGVYCDYCNLEIQGIRYKCGVCSNFDLCENCEAGEHEVHASQHDTTHLFLKIRHPCCIYSIEENGRRTVYQSMHGRTNIIATPVGGFNCKFVSDETYPDDSYVVPGEKFTKIWKITNNGSRPWTGKTKFHVWSRRDIVPEEMEILVPNLKPDEFGIISVDLEAPKINGQYETHWKLCHDGHPFGDTFWCRVRVDPRPFPKHPSAYDNPIGTMRLLQQGYLKNVRKLAKEKRKKGHSKRAFQHLVDVIDACEEEQISKMGLRKSLASSQTTTPNNTPFDLTPPKSPEPQEFVKVKMVVMPNDEKEMEQLRAQQERSTAAAVTLDMDDRASITSISSSESDEFVVIPMPQCFSILDSFQGNGKEKASKSAPESDTEKKSAEAKDSTKSSNSSRLLLEFEGSGDEDFSQEIEITDDVNFVTMDFLVKDEDKQVLVSNLSLSCSPSSSSISIVESTNYSPVANVPADSVPTPLVEIDRKDSASQIPDVSDVNECVSRVSSGESSCTFPKFPLDVETERRAVLVESERRAVLVESENKQDEERTIQVLPEGLVTGALLAAATVYNTAKAVISNFQPGKNEEEGGISRSVVTPTAAASLTPAQQLFEMGFCNRTLNEGLLKEHKGNVARVVAELINLNDNDWYASRHTPTAPSNE